MSKTLPFHYPINFKFAYHRPYYLIRFYPGSFSFVWDKYEYMYLLWNYVEHYHKGSCYCSADIARSVFFTSLRIITTIELSFASYEPLLSGFIRRIRHCYSRRLCYYRIDFLNKEYILYLMWYLFLFIIFFSVILLIRETFF